MPYTKVYATAGRTPEQKQALMAAVHRGLVDGAGIPDWDKQIRLFEFGPDNMLLPAPKAAAFSGSFSLKYVTPAAPTALSSTGPVCVDGRVMDASQDDTVPVPIKAPAVL